MEELIRNAPPENGGSEVAYTRILMYQEFLFAGQILKGDKSFDPFISQIKNLKKGRVAKRYSTGIRSVLGFAFHIDLPHAKNRWTKVIPLDQINFKTKEINGKG